MNFLNKLILDYTRKNNSIRGSTNLVHRSYGTNASVDITYTVQSVFSRDELEVTVSSMSDDVVIRFITHDFKNFLVYNILDDQYIVGQSDNIEYSRMIPIILRIFRGCGIDIPSPTFSVNDLKEVFKSLGGCI